MTRRIAAILLLEPALDANDERVKADTYPLAAGILVNVNARPRDVGSGHE